MKRFSQNKEQDIILDYFGERFGSFLSIGENDGMTLSNVRGLYECGWVGVCVDPDPKAFAKLSELYKDEDDVYCYEVAVAEKTGESRFYSSGQHLSKKDTGLLSSLKKSETKRWTKETFEDIRVKTTTWEDLYEQLPWKTFEFVSVDAEGFDYQILKQMDLDAMETEMVVIEWNGVHETRNLIEKKLKGWKMIHLNQENLIYIRG